MRSLSTAFAVIATTILLLCLTINAEMTWSEHAALSTKAMTANSDVNDPLVNHIDIVELPTAEQLKCVFKTHLGLSADGITYPGLDDFSQVDSNFAAVDAVAKASGKPKVFSMF